MAAEGRTLWLELDEAARDGPSRLAGCHVLDTDVHAEDADKGFIHEHYKDLARVERA